MFHCFASQKKHPALLRVLTSTQLAPLSLHDVLQSGVAVHAGFAHINALTELPGIIILVSLCNAHALLIRVRNFLRTRARPIANATRTMRFRNCTCVPSVVSTKRVGAANATSMRPRQSRAPINQYEHDQRNNDHHNSRQSEPVPVVNLIRLAGSGESGDAAVR
jgi:hypothetical protein